MFEVELICDKTLPLKLNPAAFKLPPVMLPDVLIVPEPAAMLPPVIVPVAEINPGVVKLAPAIAPVTLSADTTLLLRLNPAAFRLLPVILPVTDTNLLLTRRLTVPPASL